MMPLRVRIGDSVHSVNSAEAAVHAAQIIGLSESLRPRWLAIELDLLDAMDEGSRPRLELALARFAAAARETGRLD